MQPSRLQFDTHLLYPQNFILTFNHPLPQTSQKTSAKSTHETSPQTETQMSIDSTVIPTPSVEILDECVCALLLHDRNRDEGDDGEGDHQREPGGDDGDSEIPHTPPPAFASSTTPFSVSMYSCPGERNPSSPVAMRQG